MININENVIFVKLINFDSPTFQKQYSASIQWFNLVLSQSNVQLADNLALSQLDKYDQFIVASYFDDFSNEEMLDFGQPTSNFLNQYYENQILLVFVKHNWIEKDAFLTQLEDSINLFNEFKISSLNDQDNNSIII